MFRLGNSLTTAELNNRFFERAEQKWAQLVTTAVISFVTVLSTQLILEQK